jgi:hypothetical protein
MRPGAGTERFRASGRPCGVADVVLRSSAGGSSPPFLQPNPAATVHGYAGSPGPQRHVRRRPLDDGVEEMRPAAALLPRAVGARESAPQARTSSGSPRPVRARADAGLTSLAGLS